MKYNNGEKREAGARQLAQGRQRLKPARINEHIQEAFADFYEGLTEEEAYIMDTILLYRVIGPTLDKGRKLDDALPSMTLKQISEIFQISQAGAMKIANKGAEKANRQAQRKGYKKMDLSALKKLKAGKNANPDPHAMPDTSDSKVGTDNWVQYGSRG